jgi:NAD(P)-dependent dehydrogenase (short-subunit alcohol dehydrogenase family)
VSGLVDGKVAIVAGGGSGIGRSVAELFVAEGGRVLVADRTGDEKAVVDGLRAGSDGPAAVACSVDMVEPASVEAMVATAVEIFGGVDTLFNVVGVCDVFDRIADLSPDDFDRIMALNLKTAFLGMKYVIPRLLERGGGSIVNFSSAGGLAASEGLAAYGSSKAALLLLTKTAALEYGLENIRVNAVCPGPTRTPILAAAMDDSSPAYAALVASIALGRVGEPIEIAEVAVFLASDRASYVTGATVPVEGGRTASAASRAVTLDHRPVTIQR